MAESLITDESRYIVEVSVKGTGQVQKVKVLLDGDDGVTIDDCAELSRQIGNHIEETDLIKGAYTLEVSSPGVDYPLITERQFRKNIGRTLKIRRTDGKEVKGRLDVIEPDKVTVTVTKGKGRKKQEISETIPLKEIEKAIVQISFK
ncbi:MAG: ribosome maturation factor RimP [Cyclobacteriaceae bacterium]